MSYSHFQTPVDFVQTAMGSTQMSGRPTNCKSCYHGNSRGAANSNLNPATRYQTQKIIQNVVRVQSSLYTMNLHSLAAFRFPNRTQGQWVQQAGSFYYVPKQTFWNQMSDRPSPSIQKTVVASGGTYHTSSTKHTITRCRPGASSPGGLGVDIKHNSYDRYLNRIKARKPLREELNAQINGKVQGGKTRKFGIITGCNECAGSEGNGGEKGIDENPYLSPWNNIPAMIQAVQYEYHVGDYVWVYDATIGKAVKGKIVAISEDGAFYTVLTQMDDPALNVELITTTLGMSIYTPCDCSQQLSLTEQALLAQYNPFAMQAAIEAESKICCSLNKKKQQQQSKQQLLFFSFALHSCTLFYSLINKTKQKARQMSRKREAQNEMNRFSLEEEEMQHADVEEEQEQEQGNEDESGTDDDDEKEEENMPLELLSQILELVQYTVPAYTSAFKVGSDGDVTCITKTFLVMLHRLLLRQKVNINELAETCRVIQMETLQNRNIFDMQDN